jgi:uncharacterized protein (TIGR02271 family)
MTKTAGIDWSELSALRKEARGIDNYDLGEVQEIGTNYVVTQRGTIKRQKFYIPKYLAEGYDGEVLRFKVSNEEAENDFARESPPSVDEYTKYKTLEVPADIETRIPVIAERLEVSRIESKADATIIKEPVTETKTVEIPVIHEELIIERKPITNVTAMDQKEGVESKSEINIPLKSEKIQVTKEPFVKENLVVKKKPVTENRTVTEEIKSEKVKIQGPDGKDLVER